MELSLPAAASEDHMLQVTNHPKPGSGLPGITFISLDPDSPVTQLH